MIISSVKLFVISSHQAFIATISNQTDQNNMAELLLSEFNGFEGNCVLEEVDKFDEEDPEITCIDDLPNELLQKHSAISNTAVT